VQADNLVPKRQVSQTAYDRTFERLGSVPDVRSWQIVLQNSKVAAVQIFGENLKRKEVDDSHSFSRATEVAHEFGARR
jgi:hypothetical protein